MSDILKKTIIWTNTEPPRNYLWAKDGGLYEYIGQWTRSKLFASQFVPIESIAINKSRLTLRVGKTANLTTTVFPEDSTERTITWISSNSEIVEVSSRGRVKGISEGKATIYSAIGGKVASCEITVTST